MEHVDHFPRQRNAVVIGSASLAVALFFLGMTFDDPLHFVDLPGPLFDVLFPVGVVLERTPWVLVVVWAVMSASLAWCTQAHPMNTAWRSLLTVLASVVILAVSILVVLVAVATFALSRSPVLVATLFVGSIIFIVCRVREARR